MGLYSNNNTTQAQLSLAELTGTNYTIIRNVFVLTTNSNFASVTYLHNLRTCFACHLCMHALNSNFNNYYVHGWHWALRAPTAWTKSICEPKQLTHTHTHTHKHTHT